MKKDYYLYLLFFFISFIYSADAVAQFEQVTKNEYESTYFQIRKTRTLNSDGSWTATVYKYAFDFPNDNTLLAMTNLNMLTKVVEERVQRETRNASDQITDSTVLLLTKTTYDVFNSSLYLPKTIQKKQGDATNWETMVTFDEYDLKGNVTKYTTKDGLTNTFSYYTSNGKANLVNTHTDNAGNIETYDYTPLVGLKSIQDINGKTSQFEYDTFGRLSKVSDHIGQLKEYAYHYAGQSVDKPIDNNPTITTTTCIACGSSNYLNLDKSSWTPDGQANDLTVNVSSNVAWSVSSSNQTWLQVITGQQGNNNNAFSIRVLSNTSTQTRTEEITVTYQDNGVSKYQKIKVTQSSNSPTLSISPTNLSLTSSESLNNTITVSSNQIWQAALNGNEQWISITNGSGTNNGSFNIAVSNNTTTSSRTATVTVSAGGLANNLTVTQAGTTPSLSISTTNWNAPATATSTIVTLTTNIPYSDITYTSSNQSWLTVNTSGNSITLNVTANTSSIRSATVSITVNGHSELNKTINITQDAGGGTGTGCVVDKVRLIYRGGELNNGCCFDRLGGCKIQGSNDGNTWSDIYTFNSNGSGNWQEFTFSNSVSYQHLRYQAGPNSWGELSELEFYNGSTRLTGTTFGTETYARAFDGDPNTGWHAQANAGPSNYAGLHLTGCASPSGGSGYLSRKYWINNAIDGSLSSLDPFLGTTPTGTDNLTQGFRAYNWANGGVPLTDWSNNYGELIEGYITPTQSGNYTFWISSDDNSELWLSSNNSPNYATKIAFVSGWTGWDETTKEGNQKSATISLQAGTPYYVKAIHTEGGGGDNLVVRWALNNSNTPSEIVPASVLSPYSGGTGGSCVSQTPSLTANNNNVVPCTLTAAGCTGTITWSNNTTGTTLYVTTADTYTASCTQSGCTPSPLASITVTGGGTSTGCVVNKVRLIYRGGELNNGCCFDRLGGCKIQGSNDGNTWSDIYTFNSNGSGNWQEFTFSNSVSYQHLRYQAGPNSWGELSELEFYNGSTRLTGTTFGTETYARAFDGDPSTSWHAQANAGPSNYAGLHLTGCTSPSGGSGYLSRKYWINNAIDGSLSSLDPFLGTTPTGTDNLTQGFRAYNWANGGVPLTDWSNNYGELIEGYITPTQSGNYTFWISSDDNSELWLSSNNSPNYATKIAFVSGWTGWDETTKEGNQKSATISLQAGTPYYVKAIHTEGGGGDNLVVRWALNNSNTPSEIVPASVLSPYNGGGTGGTCVSPSPSLTASNNNIVPCTLTAAGCTGTITWSNNTTGTTLYVASAGTYTASCTQSGCTPSPLASITVTGGGGSGCNSSLQNYCATNIPSNHFRFRSNNSAGYTATIAGPWLSLMSGNPPFYGNASWLQGYTGVSGCEIYPTLQDDINLPLANYRIDVTYQGTKTMKLYVNGIERWSKPKDCSGGCQIFPEQPESSAIFNSVQDGDRVYLEITSAESARIAKEEIIQVESESSTLKVSPNPTQGEIKVEFDLSEEQPIRLSVINMQGKTIHVYDIDGKNGYNTLAVDLQGELPGTYIIQVEQKNKQLTSKVIKF